MTGLPEAEDVSIYYLVAKEAVAAVSFDETCGIAAKVPTAAKDGHEGIDDSAYEP